MKNIKISSLHYTITIEYDENEIDIKDALKECLKTVKTFQEDSMIEYLDCEKLNECGAW